MGSGVTSISFWVARAEIMAAENNGFGLLDSKGETTERFEEASKIGLALRSHSDLFANPSKPKAKVGIIISEDSYQFGNSFFGLKEHLVYSIRGWYHMLWRNGFAVDFVEMSQINKATANQYNALVLPVPIYLSAEDADRMQDYVSNGGNLISEAGVGRINENLMAERGEISPIIAKMAGVQQKSFTQISEPNNERRWTPTERSWGEFAPSGWLEGQGVLSGQKMLANYYLQTFKLQGGTPVFKVGNEVAGVVNNYGKGKIWLFGTFFGHGGTAYFKDSNLEFVKKLMDEAGVTPQKIGKIIVQKRIKGNKEAWILTNPTELAVSEILDFNQMKNIEVLYGDHIKIKNKTVEIQMKSLEIAVIVFEND